MVEWVKEKTMKTNRRAELNFFEDLKVTAPTFGAAILNKEGLVETLKLESF